MNETPDFTRYSLDDLRDVARHIDRKRYPERYALVMQEMEKRSSQALSPAGGPALAHDGSLLKIVRFCGGMVLLPSPAAGLAVLASRAGVPYGYGLELPEAVFMALLLTAILGSGFYASLRLQEARIANASLSTAFRVVLGGVSLLLRFFGGWFLTSLVVSHLGMYAEGDWAFVLLMVCVAGGVLAVWLPLGRKRWF